MSLKKIISALLFAILVVFAGMTCRAAEVNSNYLNGNKNFPMIDWDRYSKKWLNLSCLQLCYTFLFYGTLYQKFGNEYYPVFSDEFYDHLK